MKNLNAYLYENMLYQQYDVLFMERPDFYQVFEDLYLRLREKEHRIYEDEVLKTLPLTHEDDRDYEQWQIKKKSIDKLKAYLQTQEKTSIHILEVDCGTGWLANHLSDMENVEVCGVDINEHELIQAARVFEKKNLSFIYGDVFKDILPKESFDFVILANSIQYFPKLQKLLTRLSEYLVPDGEIHIMDSPFYQSQQVVKVEEKAKKYFDALGIPDFANFYYHHTLESIRTFAPTFLYRPTQYTMRSSKILKQYDSPFPWLKISKSLKASQNGNSQG